MHNRIIILGGPTASGKSALALAIAEQVDAVIINADSQQVYREIPIITAQPTDQEKEQAPHRLYGIVSVSEIFSVAKWLHLVTAQITATLQQGKIPLLVGGTGMYIKSLVEGISEVPEISNKVRLQVRQLCEQEGVQAVYSMLTKEDPAIASKLRPADKQRILRAYEVLLETGKSLLYWHERRPTLAFPEEMFKIFFLLPERTEVYEKCNTRVIQMLDNGLLDEMREINKLQVPPIFPAMRSHGIREFIAHLNGELTLDEAIAKTQQATRHYVKRQFTWFRHQMPGAISINTNNESLANEVINCCR